MQQYDEIILQQEQNNIIEKVSSQPTNTIKHYIPHHPVIRPDADSTKLRLVYDASARQSKNDKSLNENLLKGSVWVSELVSMLLRFRRQQTAVIADIKQAFLQIGIKPEDRDAVRFLWLKNTELPPTNDNLQIYRFTRVAFGIISSPFLLYATIRHHIQNSTSYAATVIRNDLYADNLVASILPNIDPIQFYKDIQQIFTSMSMDMAKWATNSEPLRQHIPTDKQQPNRTQSVLGLAWDTHCDTLRLKKVDLDVDEHQPITKRRALKLTAKIFDPLGWAAPITIIAKNYIRRLWLDNTTWDQSLPEKQTEWLEILQLKQSSSIEIRRPIAQHQYQESEITIHTFADASAIAYAAVSYITLQSHAQSTCSILAARNRLSPSTKLTIPRLKLLAILIGCRLTQQIITAFQFNTPPAIYIWTDSQCVLSWLHSHKVLPAVVDKQLAEIRLYPNYNFHYVPSEQNYADAASRGCTYAELRKIDWWQGPTWLLQKENWPTQPSHHISTSLTEPHFLLPASTITATSNDTSPIGICTLVITNFSSLAALLRRTAFCLHALNLLLKHKLILTQAKLDYNIALKLWLRWAQQTSFPYLKHQKSKLFRNMRIIHDDDGIIRCITRLNNADTNDETKQPVLLVRKHYLTKLIILQIHVNAQHAGVAQTLSLLRLKYWLPQGRREVHQIIHNHCYQCRRSTTTTFHAPTVAPLPEFRVTRAEYPFECTGIDLFGPLRTRPYIPPPQPTNKQKRWVILFTCTVTRAVHLELIIDTSTTEILNGIRRFIARRGTPRLFICDSAPQFHLLYQKLTNLWPTVFESKDSVSYFASRQINWKFLPPHSPWMGGHYERLISIIKKALSTTYSNLVMPDRQLETSLFEIEAMLNSRPLTYVDHNLDSNIITPNSFLHVKFPAIPLPANLDTNRDCLLNLWHATQKHLDTFWAQWSTDFLLALRDRHDKLARKHNTTPTTPAINDIVLIAEPENKRSAWRLARVERLIPSTDNIIRAVQLILGDNSRVVRPIIKLAPLHLKADLPEAVGTISADKTAIVLPDEPPNVDIESDTDDNAEIIEIELDWDADEPIQQQ